jgi:hypothetical protein
MTRIGWSATDTLAAAEATLLMTQLSIPNR